MCVSFFLIQVTVRPLIHSAFNAMSQKLRSDRHYVDLCTIFGSSIIIGARRESDIYLIY